MTTQLGLYEHEPPRRRRTRVRDTSRAAYADGRERFTGRRADVLRWLGHRQNADPTWPTSGELARFVSRLHAEEVAGRSWDWLLLYVRRGLSDLKRTGVVEQVPHGDRVCVETQSRCDVWRVRGR